MYDPKIQLEILDKIAETQDSRNLNVVDRNNLDYKFLHENGYISEKVEKVPDGEFHALRTYGVELTHKGKKLRYDTRKQFRDDCRQRWLVAMTAAILLLTIPLAVKAIVEWLCSL